MQDPNDVSESEESYEETDEEDQFADADEDDTVGTNISTSLTAATTTSKPIAKASLTTAVTRKADGTENKSIIDGDWPSLPAPSAPHKPLEWVKALSKVNITKPQNDSCSDALPAGHANLTSPQTSLQPLASSAEVDSRYINPLAVGDSFVDCVVLDTAAFVMSAPIERWARTACTVPEVLAEIRDKAARERLNSLPFALKIQEPSIESLKFASNFAKKTGDFISLSAPDLRVIALAYQLEVERNGTANIKAAPIQPTLVPLSTPAASSAKLGSAKPATKSPDVVLPANADSTYVPNNLHHAAFSQSAAEALPASSNNAATESKANAVQDNTVASSEQQEDKDVGRQNPAWGRWNANDDEGWITPANVQKVSQAHTQRQGVEEVTNTISVGCVTADFAIQNVLLQMGIRVMSIDGKVIKRIRTYVLKCSACLRVTHDNQREFCPACGNHTLYKIQVKVDNTGNVKYMEPKHRRFNLRGTIYTPPAPKGGRETNIILREDQPERTRMQGKKNNFDIFSGDFLVSASAPFAKERRGVATGKGGATQATFGYGRKNPNEARKHKK